MIEVNIPPAAEIKKELDEKKEKERQKRRDRVERLTQYMVNFIEGVIKKEREPYYYIKFFAIDFDKADLVDTKAFEEALANVKEILKALGYVNCRTILWPYRNEDQKCGIEFEVSEGE